MAEVIPFPRQLRVVPVEADPAVIAATLPVVRATDGLVEHDGRVYRLADLLNGLTRAEVQVIEATAPRTAQAAWDATVRRWPALAAEVAAGCQVVR